MYIWLSMTHPFNSFSIAFGRREKLPFISPSENEHDLQIKQTQSQQIYERLWRDTSIKNWLIWMCACVYVHDYECTWFTHALVTWNKPCSNCNLTTLPEALHGGLLQITIFLLLHLLPSASPFPFSILFLWNRVKLAASSSPRHCTPPSPLFLSPSNSFPSFLL